MAINILDSMIINRISAGEVVESPFSIVKELLDNSLDAGADNITIEIENGGIDLISVRDNGKGIERDDIVKAFLPHATSKISSIDDLEHISTLGFRGEALASISNVSQTKLVTKSTIDDCGYTIEVNGGKFSTVTSVDANKGTKIEVKNLFYNTPARRKFLRKPKQEESQITNIVARYILANPTISFKYIVNGKTVYQSMGKTLIDAIYCVYGLETTQNLLSVEKTIGNITLSGYVSKIGYSKPNTTYQTLIINNRYVIDEIVSKAVYMANEEYLMSRQFPFYVLNLTMPSVDIDVNVHPSKMNVKFTNPNQIYNLVYSAVRSAIYKSTEQSTDTEPIEPKKLIIDTDINSLKEIEIEPNITTKSSDIVKLCQSSYSPITMFDIKREDTKLSNQNISLDNQIQLKQNNINNLQDTTLTNTAHLKPVEEFVDFKIVGEIFNEFIIIERADKMLLIDFHAGHERLNYDKFTKMVQNREVVIQQLLVPYTQSLTAIEVDFILNLKDDLTALGFDIEAVGDDRIVIYSVPLQLKDINLKSFVDDLVHDMKNLKPDMNNEIRHYLMKKACKSSVKAGMTLSELEINSLIKDLDVNNPVLLCPHGRPVVTVITRQQIEKWFKRIV